MGSEILVLPENWSQISANHFNAYFVTLCTVTPRLTHLEQFLLGLEHLNRSRLPRGLPRVSLRRRVETSPTFNLLLPTILICSVTSIRFANLPCMFGNPSVQSRAQLSVHDFFFFFHLQNCHRQTDRQDNKLWITSITTLWSTLDLPCMIPLV